MLAIIIHEGTLIIVMHYYTFRRQSDTLHSQFLITNYRNVIYNIELRFYKISGKYHWVDNLYKRGCQTNEGKGRE